MEETGFCDTCGRRPVPREEKTAPRAPAPSTHTSPWPAPPPRASTARSGATSGRWPGAGGDLVSLPALDLPDPTDQLDLDPEVREDRRFCGNAACRAEVGRSYAGQPGLTEGFCPRCGTRFSFSPKLRPGDLVAGQYEVLGCLGHGGLGWVYLASDRNLDGHRVVLKGLVNTSDEQALELAVTERRFLTELDHPNIVRIFNFVSHPDPISGELGGYIVMDHVEGLSLREIRRRAVGQGPPLTEPLTVEHVVAYGLQILAAVEYLHGRGLLYCDMKPDNVIQGAGRLKVIDLGGVRRIEDRSSPVVGTPGFQVSREEIESHGLTVRSDLHAVGRTLAVMLDAVDEAAPGADGPVAFGVGSLRRVIARASDPEHDRRFASAAEMADQLRGVLREILSLRDGRPRPERSSVFAPSATLLDAGLGAVPPLEHWTTKAALPPDRRTLLADGRPPAHAVPSGLPTPVPDADDPEAGRLASVDAADPRRLLAKLTATAPARPTGSASVEVPLVRCRAHLDLGELDEAAECLSAARRALGRAAEHDWRISWHTGLVSLARDRVDVAESAFTRVLAALPAEDAPKLALGYCAEALGRPDAAEPYYEAVWRRDPAQASAAFGLARISLARGDRAGAVRVLDGVPEASRHADAARIAGVRVLAGRLGAPGAGRTELPGVDDFAEAGRRLDELYLDDGESDGDSRGRLATALLEVALAWVRRDGDAPGRAVLGCPATERDLRFRLERRFRFLAEQAHSAADHDVLVDLANAVRPVTRW
ncbi:tetratricopeptide repeat protein [Streptoalloteichus tenebrarius]|uniref:serine/threonine-protein kinase n=1 Tax=Streptoalloteichus tenebrarius (strain ATCC 17920 / DSM 40477 / JCM 4838 / CBS 697.72 / NBRC 16177 / NCIMB 11028 / NRRL B-12390 / A12253. 1 / ISP 5477) TaxID=1933 RepID=UPI0020A3856F|nr:serine/threonine-protein kinase [Streptoalloteichus tenebrarius]